jgi:hypothetical protein
LVYLWSSSWDMNLCRRWYLSPGWLIHWQNSFLITFFLHRGIELLAAPPQTLAQSRFIWSCHCPGSLSPCQAHKWSLTPLHRKVSEGISLIKPRENTE